MSKKERKKLEKQLRFESHYREWILDPDSQNVVKDLFTDKFRYLTKDFIREVRDRIDWDEVVWYVITDDELEREFGYHYFNEK